MMYAVVDIGSNTMRLVIYKVEGGRPRALLNKKEMAELASFIKDGMMVAEGINRACYILDSFNLLARELGVTDMHVFATASLRNISNSQAAVTEIEDRTGLSISLLSGAQEAEYDFVGAARTVDLQTGLLVDIGGGSTELVFYKDMEIQHAVSLPIGSLSMYTKFVSRLFPTKKERKAIENCVEDMLDRYEVSNLGDCPSVCGVGGTIRAVDKLNSYFYNLSANNRFVTSENLRAMVKRLENREDKKFIPLDTLEILLKVVPERVRTIMPGMIVLNTIVKHFKVQNIYVSRAGVREGFLYRQILSKKEEEKVNG
ncbi:phosphatase [Megamonas hypermegale]|uniref:Ppx/GppA phosphatase family protein n=1 Tax=Megamonas hypermegale TaxID=158847 RepID=UPI00242FA3C1|nr:phosphatase [Megamonas hypermegale]